MSIRTSQSSATVQQAVVPITDMGDVNFLKKILANVLEKAAVTVVKS